MKLEKVSEILLGLFLLSVRLRPRRRIVVPASLAIAAVGLYWAVERVLG